jgi:glycosyltransferase involved in cell wall biosynthesis
MGAAGSKLAYAFNVLRETFNVQRGTYNVVICGHINLLPVAALAAWLQQAPLVLIIHGVEAWEPHGSALVRGCVRRVDAFVAVSEHSKERFLEWAPLRAEQGHVIPNCIDPEPYGPGPKRDDLLTRYGLNDRTVLLTLGRLSSEEQYKGHDEVLEVLPALAEDVPDVAYLICGDGDDRPRLEAKAERLGIADRVVFAGYVPDDEKADHYRLADAFVMPGSGEGFGIVYLEALACGVPVVASTADASEEAVLGGRIGTVVDPSNLDEFKHGIRSALREDGGVPEALQHFSFERFTERWHAFLRPLRPYSRR